MKPKITTRRNVIKGVGAAGIAGIVGGSSTTFASEHDDNDYDDKADEYDDDDLFAAVRVGNLVPNIAAADQPERGPPSDRPGGGPPGMPPGMSGAHAPGSTALDLYVGKPPDRNPTVGEVYYPTFGPGAGDAYLQVSAREYDIWVTRSGDIDPLLEETIEVDAGKRYTALAVGELSDDDDELESLIIEDAGDSEEATPAEEGTEVSFVHASPNAGPVDIDVNGTRILGDVEFGDVSDYRSIPARTYDVNVKSDGETVLSLTRDLVDATRLTVYVIGLAGVEEFPDEDGQFGLSAVATIDGLNPQPRNVLTR